MASPWAVVPRGELARAADAAGEQGYLATRGAPHAARLTTVRIGIDDWAWKRGQRYGASSVISKRRRVVDLLPDREPATVEARLSQHPEVTVASATALAVMVKPPAERHHGE